MSRQSRPNPADLVDSADPVVITGGAGFIGSWLTREFLARGNCVRVLDNLSTGRRDNLPDHPSLELIVGDVTDENTVRAAVEDARLILHLASVVGMRLAHQDAECAYRVSVEGTRNVLGHARGLVVLTSSSAVYGLTHDCTVREDVVIDEAAVQAYDGTERGYALGKRHSELVAFDAASRGRRVLTLRLFNTVGPRQSGAYGMVLPTFVRRALEGQPLVVYGDGKQTRCFSDVQTVCNVILRLTELSGEEPGLYNIGSTAVTPILDLAHIVLHETGSSSAIEHIPYQHVFPGREDVPWRQPDTTHLEQQLGCVRWGSIHEIVRGVVAWERERAQTGSDFQACYTRPE